MAATTPTLYPRWYKRPFESPRQTLYHAYNLDSSLTSVSADDIPPVIDMRVLQTHDLPTHALVILDGSKGNHEPLVVPIHFAAFSATFQNVDNLRQPSQAPLPPTKHRYGTPYNDPDKGGWTVTLPTLVIEAPHPPSLPLLLLYSLWDTLPNQPPAELTPPPSPDSLKSSTSTMPTTPPPTPATVASFGSQSSIASPRAPSPPPEPPRPLVCPAQLAAHLLPAAVLGEFPGYPAQAAALARACDDAALRAHCAFNGGLWRNVLLLAPRAHTIQDIASNAWNIAAAAYKSRAEFRAEPARARRRQEPPQRAHSTAAAAPADKVAGESEQAAPSAAPQTEDGTSGGREAPPAAPEASAAAAVQEEDSRRNG